MLPSSDHDLSGPNPPERLTPAFVQQTLRLQAGLEISAADAAAIIPIIEANQRTLALLDRFALGEVRPALMFDPTRQPAP